MRIHNNIRKGSIYLVDFGGKSEVRGSEQGGIRPAIVVQNNKGNLYSPTIIVVPITSKLSKKPLPTHVFLKKEYFKDLPNGNDSQALCEVIRTISKERIVSEEISFLNYKDMDKINEALLISIGI